MKTSVELREERAGLVKQAREILNRATAESRDSTAEEMTDYDRIMEAIDGLKAQIDRIEKLENVEEEQDAPAERNARPADVERRDRQDRDRPRPEETQRAAYRHFLRTGIIKPELREEQRRLAEYRDTVISTDAKGGYLIAPVAVADDLVQTITDQVFMRQLATVRTVTDAKKLGIRKLVTHMADANWTTEVQAVTEDTTMAFDRRDLEPYRLSKLAKVSNRTLLLASDAEQIIRDELAYKFAVTEEKAFLTGDGSSKPLGIFTASASGISTGRDVAAASATAVVGDDFINAKYALKAAYQNDASTAWIMHRDLVKATRKLKDSQGTYIWSPGLTAGEPDRILDTPFYMSEFAPNTYTTGLYAAVIGAFRFYTIAQVQDLVIQRLVELYAATDETGFIGRRWVDGAPILEEAFVRLKMA